MSPIDISFLSERESNVYILADETTAAFFAGAGANAIDPTEFDVELLFEFLQSVDCELLLVSEDMWDTIKKFADKVTFPPIVLIPPFGGERGAALRRLRSVSEKALGLDLLSGEPDDIGGAPSGD